MRQRAADFADASGNIALFFSIAVLPQMFAASSALDYSYASITLTKLNAAADASALAAVSHEAIAVTRKEAERLARGVSREHRGPVGLHPRRARCRYP